MGFARFMSGTTGRSLRIGVGVAMISGGLFAMKGTRGKIVGALGVLPLATGTLNVCTLGPLFGGHLSGKKNLQQ